MRGFGGRWGCGSDHAYARITTRERECPCATHYPTLQPLTEGGAPFRVGRGKKVEPPPPKKFQPCTIPIIEPKKLYLFCAETLRNGCESDAMLVCRSLTKVSSSLTSSAQRNDGGRLPHAVEFSCGILRHHCSHQHDCFRRPCAGVRTGSEVRKVLWLELWSLWPCGAWSSCFSFGLTLCLLPRFAYVSTHTLRACTKS